MTVADEIQHGFGALEAISIRARRRVVWELLLLSARRAGIAAAELRRVEEYLAVTFGLARAAYVHPQQRPRNCFPGLSARPWYDQAEYDWTERLRAAYDVIRSELDTIRGGPGVEPATQQHPLDIEVQGRWDVFYFYVYGRPHPANRALCPRTTALIDSIPALCSSGITYFSALTAARTSRRMRAQQPADPLSARVIAPRRPLPRGDRDPNLAGGQCLVLTAPASTRLGLRSGRSHGPDPRRVASGADRGGALGARRAQPLLARRAPILEGDARCRGRTGVGGAGEGCLIDDRCGWWATLPEPAPARRLCGEERAHCVVVGRA